MKKSFLPRFFIILTVFAGFSLGTIPASAQTIPFGLFKTQKDKLAFSTTAQTLAAGNCSGITTIQYRGPSGSAKNVTSDLTVNLTALAGVTYYSDSFCITPITSVTISNGTNSASYYFISDTTGTKSLAVTTASNLSASQNETINTNPYVWTGGGGNANWSTGANWSGGSAPGTSNTALFNGTCSSNCSPTISASIDVGGVRMASDYAGTITQAASQTVTIESNGWTQLAGTFAGGDSAITLNSPFRLAGGTFTSTSGQLTLKGSNSNWYLSGSPTFNHNSGTLYFWTGGTTSITPGTVAYNNVTFYCHYGSTWNLGGNTMTVNGTLTLNEDGGSGYGVVLNTGTIAAYGDVSFLNYGMNRISTAVIQVSGNAAGQTISAGASAKAANLTIAAGTNNVTFGNSLTICGNYIVNSVGTLTTTGVTLTFYADFWNVTLTPGSVAYNDITFSTHYGGTWNLGGGTMTVNGTLTMKSDVSAISYLPTVNSGTILAYGNVSLPANFGGFNGTAVLQIAGNAAGQTITGGSPALSYNAGNITIAAGTNNVTISGTLIVGQSFIVSSVGTLTTTGSTMGTYTDGTSVTLNPGNYTYNKFTISANWGGTVNLGGGTLNIAGDLSINSKVNNPISVNSGTIKVSGNVTDTAGGANGTAQLQFVGSSDQTLTVGSGTPLLSGNVTVNTTSGANLILASDVSWNNTGQTLTVTAGGVNMLGYALTVKGLSLNSTTVTKGGGALVVNGTTVGTGSLYGGTIAP